MAELWHIIVKNGKCTAQRIGGLQVYESSEFAIYNMSKIGTTRCLGDLVGLQTSCAYAVLREETSVI